MRRLTVVNVAYPLAPVGSGAVGGAEQVLSAIDGALVAAGHRSIVVAVDGSTGSGELRTFPPPRADRLGEAEIAGQQARAAATLASVLETTPVDVVHMHGIDFDRYLPLAGPPVLVTLHLPLGWYSAEALAPTRPATWLHCVSESQAASATENVRMLPPIANGVPVAELQRVRVSRRNYALMLARICSEKGQHLALQAAHAADTPLLIGGEVFPYPAHQAYFEREVRPLLDRRRRYVGPLGFARKRRLLAGAACLLVPSLAPETSSLVAMEAASCGTPVIAFRAGALPDIVKHGRSGFLVDDVDAMAASIPRVAEIDPQTCRALARRCFSVERMTEAYIAQYRELAGSSAIRAA